MDIHRYTIPKLRQCYTTWHIILDGYDTLTNKAGKPRLCLLYFPPILGDTTSLNALDGWLNKDYRRR